MLADTYMYFSWQVAYIGVVLHQHVLMDYNSNFDHRASTKTIVMHWKDSGEVQHRLYAPIIKLSQARHTKYSSKVVEHTLLLSKSNIIKRLIFIYIDLDSLNHSKKHSLPI